MKTINVIKRDGNVVSFDSNKIFDAIYKASVDTKIGLDVDLAKGISDQVEKEVEKMESSPTVEMIQDMVEEALMESNRKDIARKYILFRNKRTEVREDKSSFMRLYDSIVQIDDQDLMQENANVDGQSPMGQMGKIGFESAKLFAQKRMMSQEVKQAVADNLIHVHDLDFMPTGTATCCQIPLGALLRTGFNTGHGHMRTPQSIGSAASLTAIILQANQN